MNPSDAQLVEAACHGDVAGFQTLYERHWRLAVGIGFHCLGDRHLAEDAAQAAFAVACRKLAGLRDGDRFPQWLCAICRMTATRLRRQRRHHEPVEIDQLVVHDDQSVALRASVQEALDQLGTAAREVIVLHYFSELSYAEISQALGISTQSVHGRLQRARHKLAQILRPEIRSSP